MRKLLLTASGLCMSLMVALALGELALRIQEPFLHLMQRRYDQNTLYPPHPVWDHWMRPNIDVTTSFLNPVQYPRPLSYKTNSQGCRYPQDLAIPKPSGVKRILILGDSFTEGLYFEDTAAVWLERRVNEARGADRIQVINCGCVSYSPFLHYIRLRDQLLDLQPDAVVVNIDLTDVYDDYWRYRLLFEFSKDGEPLRMRNPLRWWNRFVGWSVAHTKLGRVVYSHRRRFLQALYRLGVPATFLGVPPNESELFSYHSTLSASSERWQRDVQYCLDNVGRIIRLCQNRGIHLIVTTYPHRKQLQAGPRDRLWNRDFEFRVQGFCRAKGVDFYSAFDDIGRAFHSGQPVYWERDMHFTPEGQRIWSDVLSRYLAGRLRYLADVPHDSPPGRL